MIKLTIIIPVYNEGEFIYKNLKEILKSEQNNYEIIVINDGSTDNTEKEIKKIKDDRLIFLSKQNGGVSSARNVGIELARGQYIIFVDADDKIDLNVIDEITNISFKLENRKLYFYNSKKITRWKTINNIEYKNIANNLDKEKEFKSLLYQEKLNHPWGKIYYTNIIHENSIKFDESLIIGEDLDFNLEYLKYVKGIDFLDIGYYYYVGIGEQSLTGKFDEKKYASLSILNKKIKNSELYTKENEQVFLNIELKHDFAYLRYLAVNRNQEFYIHLENMKNKKYALEKSGVWTVVLFSIKHLNSKTNYILTKILDKVIRLKNN